MNNDAPYVVTGKDTYRCPQCMEARFGIGQCDRCGEWTKKDGYWSDDNLEEPAVEKRWGYK